MVARSKHPHIDFIVGKASGKANKRDPRLAWQEADGSRILELDPPFTLLRSEPSHAMVCGGTIPA
jgi:hypothetical protein